MKSVFSTFFLQANEQNQALITHVEPQIVGCTPFLVLLKHIQTNCIGSFMQFATSLQFVFAWNWTLN